MKAGPPSFPQDRRFMPRDPLESGAPPFKKMMMSIDVGLVVVGADLVGLVDRHTTGFGYR